MLSFNNNQKPLYDYYVETDLDSFDDQPVDYSKKYSDQDSYEECRRTKSILKSNEISPEVPQTTKQSCNRCNDEVKVYCIEGTPLTISYASSLSDLREIGTNCPIDKSDAKNPFSSVNNGCTDSFDVDSKKDVELLDSNNEESPLSKEKEGKSVSFRNSTDISKASSPLMFSRSSSIGSLTSFEQQSIVDDRSSVSVFSALTSGLISPSDLPDSPGELMSPTLTDKDDIPKTDVTKADFDNQSENIQPEVKEENPPKQNLLNDVKNEITMELSENEMNVSPDSHKDSEDDNEVMAQQLETSNDSLDEVFENPDYHNNTSLSLQNEEELSSKSDEESDDDEILLQQCIELGMPSNSSNVSAPDIETAKQPVVFDINLCCDEKASENSIIKDREPTSQKDLLLKIGCDSTKIESKDAEELKFDEDSDEDDKLLQHCIQLGMPENVSDSTISGSEAFAKPVYTSPTNCKTEKVLENQACSKSDDDLDADDIILQQCIELGMSDKPPVTAVPCPASKTVECHIPNGKINPSQQIPFKDRSKSYHPPHSNTNNMTTSYQQYRMSPKINNNIGMDNKPVNVRQPSPAKKIPKNVCIKSCAIKSDVDYDCDESDLLLQHLIEMGMPKNFPDKKSISSRTIRKPEVEASQFMFHRINDMRDNCPDGISDGDEDDVILEKCIRAGMPSPKAVHSMPNRLPILQNKQACQKVQMTSRSLVPGISLEPSKKYNPVRLPPNQPYAPVHSGGTWISNTSFIDVDSMRIYRTEDTPVLSPTASVSDLSSLSINESFLNNSRNSDCSSESDDDDELLLQCIRSGMPEAKRAVA